VPTAAPDQKLLEIRQEVVLRAKEQGAVAFQSGSYARPTEQLATTLASITQSLTSTYPEHHHHD
jgi:hypothetical protein